MRLFFSVKKYEANISPGKWHRISLRKLLFAYNKSYELRSGKRQFHTVGMGKAFQN